MVAKLSFLGPPPPQQSRQLPLEPSPYFSVACRSQVVLSCLAGRVCVWRAGNATQRGQTYTPQVGLDGNIKFIIHNGNTHQLGPMIYPPQTHIQTHYYHLTEQSQQLGF